ncbi:MAG: hypothetical protein ACLSAL_06270 [Thomasclavelia spiroformis]|uniref:hypothetical protein n=1 Tax=Thomasclavelia spiroformis TaxID=29348 RepID=UPI0039A3B877
MKYINKIAPLVVVISFVAIAVLMVDYERKIDKQSNHIQLLQEELNDSRDEVKYYQKQYKKYFELSEELENQLGVYSN